MKLNNKIVLSSIVAAMVAFSGCGESSSSSSPATPAVPNCDASFEVLPSTISTNMTLDATKVYGLDGKVKVDSGAVLTIPAGTTIAGCTPNSFMVITPGSQINANGTQAAPITFTSQKDVLGNSADNSAGEWGGLVLAGTAYTHYSNNKYEADETVLFGSATHTDDNTSSGTLNYVAIKHSGYEVELDKELNGLSLAGVGSGTTLTNIAIIGGLDDGLEIWGGTPNITGLYVYNAQDDSVDTDLGYRGTITDVLVQQVNVDSLNNHDSAGMEFGNDHNTIDTTDANATKPIIVNYTAHILGGGISIKNDAGLSLTNVQFISDKATDTEQVFYRTTDVIATAAMNVDGAVCFKDNNVTLTDALTYSAVNGKADSNGVKNVDTAFDDWTFTANSTLTLASAGSIQVDSTTCTGVVEANIWKGKAGTNDPLELP